MRAIIVLSLLAVASAQHPGRNEMRANRGEFLVYTLHSGNYFPRAIDVTWSASMVGKPNLPNWMHLAPSRFKAIAFLFGTPISPNRSVEIEVVARSIETFELSKKIVNVQLTGDDVHQYTGTTIQLADIYIKNHDPYDFFTDRGQLIPRLESAIRETFRGRKVLPYIADLQPATHAPDEDLAHAQRHNRKIGTKVSVGTQHGFHEGVRNLAVGLRTNAQYCDRNRLVPLDKHFAPTFEVDWCKFQVRNITSLEAALQQKKQQQLEEIEAKTVTLGVDDDEMAAAANESLHYDVDERPHLRRSYFWDWIMIVPVPAVGLILLILLLSFIFFGRREGQHWRDYKTPKHQLQEYISLRHTQDHLRELSAQRQMLLPMDERRPPIAAPHPPGIQSFLRPKNGSVIASVAPTQRSASVAPDSTAPSAATPGPVGKQTVAEAAKARGSSLNLYRHPSKDEELDDDEEEGEEEEEEVEEEEDQPRASADVKNSSTKLASNDWTA